MVHVLLSNYVVMFPVHFEMFLPFHFRAAVNIPRLA